MKYLLRFCLRRMDIMYQLSVKRALRLLVDQPIDKRIEGQSLLKQYAKELLDYFNKGEMIKF